ncbi:MAG: multicopper oxidase domain-containing protein [Acidobacteriaceae bacterium]
MKRAVVALAGFFCLSSLVLLRSFGDTGASEPAEPPVFTSAHHVLDLLAIAEPATITLGDRHPVAWVFAMCRRAVAQKDECPADSRTFAPYGGIRLQLYPGDHLRIRLINRLPPAPADAMNAHGSDAMMNAMLAENPVNIHTHGLIVAPRKADAADPTWGDDVYVLGYPAGKLPRMVSPDETATDEPIQYDIEIPRDHPSGLYWFHPHVHGLNINQLSEGLSGIITIGRVADYASAPGGSEIPQRYLILKDMQVMGNSAVVDQEDSTFCAPYDYVQVERNGSCQGRNTSGTDGDLRPPPGALSALRSGAGAHHFGSTGADYTGGLWYFTINGQVDPRLPAPSGSGELWRILNAGASRTYDLVLRDDQTHALIPFQIIALNGAALSPPAGTVGVGVRSASTNAAGTVPCQGHATGSTEPVCATHLVLFPGARAEIWVTPQAHSATLLTEMIATGPAGDRWPQANLARIVAGQPAAVPALLDVRAVAANTRGDEGSNRQDSRVHDGLRSETSCTALPPGHRRRIFFGVPSSNRNAYGLGYEEVDEKDQPVPGTFRDVAAFDPSVISVCLPLGPHDTPVTEDWELVNVSAEAHNFHIHQARFTVLAQNAPPGDGGERMDSVALPNGGAACDGTVATWRAGRCRVATVVVRIPFSEPGDFVYHCHIGEHQDSGMMAHIRVLASR